MKNFKKTYFLRAFFLVAGCASVFIACKDDDEPSGAAPSIERVSLMLKDSTTHSGKRGENYIIYGSNLATTKTVLFNDEPAFVNINYVLDGSILITIPGEAPYVEVEDKLKVITEFGEAEIDFAIEQPKPVISSFNPIAASAGDIVTIKGDIFDNLISVKFNDVMAEIVNASPKEIQVKVPEGIAAAFIYVTTKGGTTQSTDSYGFKYIIFDDALKAGWTQWGWGGPIDWANTEQVRRGTHAMKKTYESGYSGFQSHNEGDLVPLGNYNAIKVSIYGGPGTTGKEIRLVVNGQYGDGQFEPLIITEGQWTDFTVPFTELNNPTTLDEVVLQNVDAGVIIWIDDLGLI